jgi:pimeloyl-ACP methyl ester carboxylesterase
MPVAVAPSPESIAYWKANPQALDNGGHGAANDVNVPDLIAFVRAVMAYTGSKQVQIVAHSLGVTIVRKMLYAHPDLRRNVVAAVMIAGANHGTTVCRGLETSYYGCDEIAPGTTWLAQLNAAGEAPGPTCWMSVYDGATGDPFFVGPDATSPHLDGAYNLTFPGFYHNDLRVDPRPVAAYSAFLKKHQRPDRPCEVA